MFKILKRSGVLLLLVLLVASACGSDEGGGEAAESDDQTTTSAPTDDSTASDATPETTSLKVGMASPNGSPFAGTLVAVAQGFFEAEGLDVEALPFQGGPASLQALFAGEVQFTEQDFTPVLSAYANKNDVVVFQSTASFPSYSFYGGQGITSWQDLVDKKGTVGVSAIGGMDYILVRHALEEEGFDPDAVNYRAAGGPADRARGALAGQLQLVASSPPGKYDLAAEGLTLLGDLTDSMDTFPLEQYTTTQKFYDENPNTIAAIRRAYAAAATWMADNPDKTVDILMQAESALEEDRPNLEKAFKEYLPFYNPSEPPMDGYRLLTQFFIDDGIITGSDVDTVLDEILALKPDA